MTFTTPFTRDAIRGFTPPLAFHLVSHLVGVAIFSHKSAYSASVSRFAQLRLRMRFLLAQANCTQRHEVTTMPERLLKVLSLGVFGSLLEFSSQLRLLKSRFRSFRPAVSRNHANRARLPNRNPNQSRCRCQNPTNPHSQVQPAQASGRR